MIEEHVIKEAFDFGMIQNGYEITSAAKFFHSLEVKNFLEVGTDKGGTFLTWSRLSDPDGLKISVDWAQGPWSSGSFDVEGRNEKMLTLGSNVHILNGDSHTEKMLLQVKEIIKDEKLDFLFIDGDHSYAGVKLDFHMYKGFVKPGGWVGFHDIKNTEWHHMNNCYVDQFWNEVQGEKIMFIDDRNEWGGIGLIRV